MLARKGIRTATMGAVAALAGTALLAGCGGGSDTAAGSSGEETAVAAHLDARDTQCPTGQSSESTPMADLDQDATFDAVLLDPETGVEGWGGTYCLQVSFNDATDARPTRVTLAAPENSANYGTSQTATASEHGSEEITYFPFVVGVYGKCRPVTAQVTLADGSTHRARLNIGTGCENDQ